MGDQVPPPSDTPGGGGSVSVLERLLEVQDHDTAIDQLHHRRASLPERVQLRDVQQRLSVLDQRTKQSQIERDDLASRQSGLEQQIEASKSRKKELERKMFAGQVAAPRELQAMDEEVKHLGRHISELEDREIEVMEALEPLDTELQSNDVERDSLENEGARLRALIEEAERTMVKDIGSQVAERDRAAEAIPSDLLSRYEQLRKKLGGTGAARLVNGSCGGCHLALPAMEVDRIKRTAPDILVTCDQCGRILVR
jgi:uncharacterized protein